MKVLIEAYDSSAPSWIKKFLSDPVYGKTRGWHRNRAGNMIDFDASTARFINGIREPVSELRKLLRSGEYLFFVLATSPKTGESVPIRIWYDPNKSNGIGIEGSKDFNNASFKHIVDTAVSIYYTPVSNDRKDKRADRYASRSGMVSRDTDSAQNPDLFRTTSAADLARDASGYYYDAQQLIKKLAKMHADDPAYRLNKATQLFQDMVDMYTDKIKTMSRDRTFDTDAYSKTGFTYILREGGGIITDASRKMNDLVDYIDNQIPSLEEYAPKFRTAHPDFDGPDEELKLRFNDYVNYMSREIDEVYLDIQQYNKQMKSLVNA